MQHPVCVVRLICTGIVYTIAAQALAEIPPVIAKTNAWTVGQPIPQGLLTFRDSDSCIVDQSDTTVVFSEITNYYLLQAVLAQTSDERVFECAVRRALDVAGPSRFFHDTEAMYAATPQLLAQPRHRALHERAKLRHVQVDGIFISDRDMSHEEVGAVFARIATELHAGQPFDTVQKKYYDTYEYAYTETLSDGATVVLHRTQVGNYGGFVVSAAEHTARPLRLADLPAEHVRPLLGGRTGDVIILRHENERETMLYRVRDVYSPEKPNQAMERTANPPNSWICEL